MKDSTRGGIIATVIILALVAYFAVWMPGCGEQGPGGGGGGNVMKKGEAAPDFSDITIDGQNIKLSEFIGDKPVVLDFFATWCGPCMAEMPVLQEFYAANSDKVVIIAVSDEDAGSAGKIQAAIQAKGITFPVIHDSDKTISSMYPTNAIPYLVFIDKDGNVVDTHLGADPNIGNAIKQKFGL